MLTWAASVQVRPYCSDPARTQWTPNANGYQAYPEDYPPIAIAPTHMAINHSLDGVANFIDLAIAGMEGSSRNYIDEGSAERWGKHTYTRHDLEIVNDPYYGPLHLDKLGARYLSRLGQAVYSIENLSFPVSTSRDIVAFVGSPYYSQDSIMNRSMRNGFCTPGDWWSIHWEEPHLEAYLLLCSVTHSITPASWSVTISGELAQVNGPGPSGLPVPVPAALSVLEPV